MQVIVLSAYKHWSRYSTPHVVTIIINLSWAGPFYTAPPRLITKTLNLIMVGKELKDLQCPYLIAGCKALGIIDKIVTGDVFKVLLFLFWR